MSKYYTAMDLEYYAAEVVSRYQNQLTDYVVDYQSDDAWSYHNSHGHFGGLDFCDDDRCIAARGDLLRSDFIDMIENVY